MRNKIWDNLPINFQSMALKYSRFRVNFFLILGSRCIFPEVGKNATFFAKKKQNNLLLVIILIIPKTQIFYEMFWRMRSNSSEDLIWISSENITKIFRRKDFNKIWSKIFLLKIFKRSSKNFIINSFWDLWKIFSSNIFEILGRSSFQMF